MKNGEAFSRATYPSSKFLSARMAQILLVVEIHGCPRAPRTHRRRQRAGTNVSALETVRTRLGHGLDDARRFPQSVPA